MGNLNSEISVIQGSIFRYVGWMIGERILQFGAGLQNSGQQREFIAPCEQPVIPNGVHLDSIALAAAPWIDNQALLRTSTARPFPAVKLTVNFSKLRNEAERKSPSKSNGFICPSEFRCTEGTLAVLIEPTWRAQPAIFSKTAPS